MGSESNPGMSSRNKPDALSVAQANLADINRILENITKNPDRGKFMNVDALQERKKKLTEDIENLGSTDSSGPRKFW